LLAMTIKDLRPPEEVPRLAEYLPRAGEGLNLWGEWRHRKKDGTEINVEITFHNITWLGRPSRLVLVKDITDHKRALKALEDAEQKFRSIFENAVVGMFQTTEEGRLLTANLALARIYGYESPGDLMRSVNNINKLYVDPPGRAEFLRRLSERGAAWGFEAQQGAFRALRTASGRKKRCASSPVVCSSCRTRSDGISQGSCTTAPPKTSRSWQGTFADSANPAASIQASTRFSPRRLKWRKNAREVFALFPTYSTHPCWMRSAWYALWVGT